MVPKVLRRGGQNVSSDNRDFISERSLSVFSVAFEFLLTKGERPVQSGRHPFYNGARVSADLSRVFEGHHQSQVLRFRSYLLLPLSKMACGGFFRTFLNVMNVLFALVGLAMIGYGLYMLIIWLTSSSSSSSPSPPPPPPLPWESTLSHWSPPTSVQANSIERVSADGGIGVLQLRRTLLQRAPKEEIILLSSFWSRLPKAWFIFLFIAVGVVITLITCSGCIAAATTNGCCLSCYSIFVALVIIVELALAGFIVFDKSWDEVIPDDSTGQLDSIKTFIADKMYIFQWVALGILVLEAIALLSAILLRGMGSQAPNYDSDDELVASRGSRQPLVNRQPISGTGTTSTGTDGRPARTDAWSTRMREKYGLDTTEFSYNPADSKRQPQSAAPEEKKSRCSIM